MKIITRGRVALGARIEGAGREEEEELIRNKGKLTRLVPRLVPPDDA